MRYFLSPLDSSGGGLVLGIPSEAVSSLLYFSGEMRGPFEEDGDEQRFSLPCFFGFGGEVRYGIVLKGERRRVLLLTAVDREAEFFPGQFHRPPPLFGALGGLDFITGLCFETPDSGDSQPLLLLDPFKLVDVMLGRRDRCSTS
jgi:hypothetical protein